MDQIYKSHLMKKNRTIMSDEICLEGNVTRLNDSRTERLNIYSGELNVFKYNGYGWTMAEQWLNFGWTDSAIIQP